jgi:hypothetical protein
VGYLFLVFIKEYVNELVGMNEKILYVISSSIHYIMTIMGILFVYLLVCNYTYKPSFKLSSNVFYLSSVCYGVYVYHQFILEYLYYYTSFPFFVGELFLPWVSFILVLFISYILTFLSLKTRIGRFLIG